VHASRSPARSRGLAGIDAVTGVMALVVVAAWLVLALAADMGGTGTMGASAGAWVGGWALMIAAMMGPSALWFTRAAARDHRSAAVLGSTYLALWVLVGVAAYGLALLVDVLDERDPGALPYVSGAALVLAGAYQLTPLKDRCLTRCRLPLGVLLGVRGGRGVLRAGAAYASWCVACCAPLMAALVIAGLMGPWWVALVGAYVLLERASAGVRVPQLLGASLVVLGALVATVPALAPTARSMTDATTMEMSR
jgi:predicted metal-binding membrane protein